VTVTIRYGMPNFPSSGITPYRSLRLHTPPAVEPVTLAEAKAQAKIDIDDDDALIQSYITMSREYVEQILDVTLITQVLEARYDTFPLWEIILPRPPMAAANVTVIYRDEAGVERTITSAANQFQVDNYVTPGRIYPNYTGVWPAIRGDENSVTVRWTAGYGAAGANVPPITRQLILLQVAHLYEHRQPVVTGYSQVLPVPQTFETLLAASGWGGYR
jgi:uncharacterized phiE125 gp8 family phage protein